MDWVKPSLLGFKRSRFEMPFVPWILGNYGVVGGAIRTHIPSILA